MDANVEQWIGNLKEFCQKFNIPIEHIREILNDPKVVPMIRGKAFEFSVVEVLQSILPKDIWEVSKPMMNAQLGFHDMDVKLIHIQSGEEVNIECKLSAKGSFQTHKKGSRTCKKGESIVKVKCMRSRTLGAKKVKELAPILKVTEQQLSAHNDQYRIGSFDVVITSLANAFYETDKMTQFYEWKPTDSGVEFLQMFEPEQNSNLKDFAFNLMYVAKTTDLITSVDNNIKCTRKSCSNKTDCGFIPNYPIIKSSIPDEDCLAGGEDSKPKVMTKAWVGLENCEPLFLEIVEKKIKGEIPKTLEIPLLAVEDDSE